MFLVAVVLLAAGSALAWAGSHSAKGSPWLARAMVGGGAVLVAVGLLMLFG
jgi:cytochrome c biogenesis protein CcdA